MPSLDIVTVQKPGLGMIYLTSKGAWLDLAIQENVQICRLGRIRINKLVLNVLHTVVLAVEDERVWFRIFLQLFFLFLLTSLSFDNLIPVDVAFAWASPGKIRQSLLLGLLLLFFALELPLALLLSLNQPAQVI